MEIPRTDQQWEAYRRGLGETIKLITDGVDFDSVESMVKKLNELKDYTFQRRMLNDPRWEIRDAYRDMVIRLTDKLDEHDTKVKLHEQNVSKYIEVMNELLSNEEMSLDKINEKLAKLESYKDNPTIENIEEAREFVEQLNGYISSIQQANEGSTLSVTTSTGATISDTINSLYLASNDDTKELFNRSKALVEVLSNKATEADNIHDVLNNKYTYIQARNESISALNDKVNSEFVELVHNINIDEIPTDIDEESQNTRDLVKGELTKLDQYVLEAKDDKFTDDPIYVEEYNKVVAIYNLAKEELTTKNREYDEKLSEVNRRTLLHNNTKMANTNIDEINEDLANISESDNVVSYKAALVRIVDKYIPELNALKETFERIKSNLYDETKATVEDVAFKEKYDLIDSVIERVNARKVIYENTKSEVDDYKATLTRTTETILNGLNNAVSDLDGVAETIINGEQIKQFAELIIGKFDRGETNIVANPAWYEPVGSDNMNPELAEIYNTYKATTAEILAHAKAKLEIANEFIERENTYRSKFTEAIDTHINLGKRVADKYEVLGPTDYTNKGKLQAVYDDINSYLQLDRVDVEPEFNEFLTIPDSIYNTKLTEQRELVATLEKYRDNLALLIKICEYGNKVKSIIASSESMISSRGIPNYGSALLRTAEGINAVVHDRDDLRVKRDELERTTLGVDLPAEFRNGQLDSYYNTVESIKNDHLFTLSGNDDSILNVLTNLITEAKDYVDHKESIFHDYRSILDSMKRRFLKYVTTNYVNPGNRAGKEIYHFNDKVYNNITTIPELEKFIESYTELVNTNIPNNTEWELSIKSNRFSKYSTEPEFKAIEKNIDNFINVLTDAKVRMETRKDEIGKAISELTNESLRDLLGRINDELSTMGLRNREYTVDGNLPISDRITQLESYKSDLFTEYTKVKDRLNALKSKLDEIDAIKDEEARHGIVARYEEVLAEFNKVSERIDAAKEDKKSRLTTMIDKFKALQELRNAFVEKLDNLLKVVNAVDKTPEQIKLEFTDTKHIADTIHAIDEILATPDYVNLDSSYNSLVEKFKVSDDIIDDEIVRKYNTIKHEGNQLMNAKVILSGHQILLGVADKSNKLHNAVFKLYNDVTSALKLSVSNNNDREALIRYKEELIALRDTTIPNETNSLIADAKASLTAVENDESEAAMKVKVYIPSYKAAIGDSEASIREMYDKLANKLALIEERIEDLKTNDEDKDTIIDENSGVNNNDGLDLAEPEDVFSI